MNDNEINFRDLFFNMVLSMSIADNLKDIFGDVDKALSVTGYHVNDWDELRELLISNGFVGLYGEFEDGE